MSEGYARGWRHAWTAFAAVTLCVAAVMWSAGSVVLLLGVATVITSITLVVTASGPDQRGSSIHLGRLVLRASRWAVLEVALVATAVLEVGLGLLLLAAVVVTSPRVVRVMRGAGAGAAPRRAERALDASGALHALDLARARQVVRRLDLAGLCWAWRHSAELLVELADTPAHGAVVSLRELYLDEMERRDPAGFAVWLDSGAEAIDSPELFLAGPYDGGQPGGVAA